ncbi:MAG: hypothetical protein F6K28_56435, partial [Microcoleus sp. SIO2G3]|nr:hypothetical protein [Microcoleus sp. SIO2G3]
MRSEAEQENQLSELDVLDERISSLIFFQGNISQWTSDTCHFLKRVFGEVHHSIEDINLVVQSIGYESDTLALDLYRQDEWKEVKERIIEILQACRRELDIIASQSSRNRIADQVEAFGYVSAIRLQELKTITSERIDLTKLIRLCEELNIA